MGAVTGRRSRMRSLIGKPLRPLRRGLRRIGQRSVGPMRGLLRGIVRTSTSAVVTPYFPNRIGHLIVDPAAFLLASGHEHGRHGSGRDLLAVSRRVCANRTVLDSWKEHYRVVSSPRLVSLLTWATAGTPLGRSGASLYGAVQPEVTTAGSAFDPQAPILRVPDKVAKSARRVKERVLPDSPFVCLHVRPANSPYFFEDPKWFSYRVGDIATYADAVRYLQGEGLAVILMGDSSQPKPDPALGLIDYAHSALKSDSNDVLLAANCEFWLGDNSGASALAWAYGRPTAIANLAPISHLLWGNMENLMIPRLYARADGSVLSFAEALTSPAQSAQHEDIWRAAGIWPVMNTPDELRDLAVEMLARVRGAFVAQPEDLAREDRLRSFFTPDHATYGGSARIAHSFLRRHSSLLEARSSTMTSGGP